LNLDPKFSVDVIKRLENVENATKMQINKNLKTKLSFSNKNLEKLTKIVYKIKNVKSFVYVSQQCLYQIIQKTKRRSEISLNQSIICKHYKISPEKKHLVILKIDVNLWQKLIELLDNDQNHYLIEDCKFCEECSRESKEINDKIDRAQKEQLSEYNKIKDKIHKLCQDKSYPSEQFIRIKHVWWSNWLKFIRNEVRISPGKIEQVSDEQFQQNKYMKTKKIHQEFFYYFESVYN